MPNAAVPAALRPRLLSGLRARSQGTSSRVIRTCRRGTDGGVPPEGGNHRGPAFRLKAEATRDEFRLKAEATALRDLGVLGASTCVTGAASHHELSTSYFR